MSPALVRAPALADALRSDTGAPAPGAAGAGWQRSTSPQVSVRRDAVVKHMGSSQS
jgi:hypothetical protein